MDDDDGDDIASRKKSLNAPPSSRMCGLTTIPLATHASHGCGGAMWPIAAPGWAEPKPQVPFWHAVEEDSCASFIPCLACPSTVYSPNVVLRDRQF